MNLSLVNLALPLAHFTLTVDAELSGRVTAIFGPSGAGKTSLLEIVAGLRQPLTGRVRVEETVLFDGVNGVNIPVAQRRMGYVPQDLALFPHLSVKQNILYGYHPSAEDASRMTPHHVIALLELGNLLLRKTTALSGGERQRVAFARALLSQPRLLLLDEPLASLDGELKARILKYLRRIRDEFAVPMLYVTHDRTEALALADEMVVLDNGMIRQCGPVLEVFNRPASAEVARIVGVETIQPGVVLKVENDLATVEIGQVRLTAVMPPTCGCDVFACIRGEEVILQPVNEAATSVRNRLPARVVMVRPEGPLNRVELDAGFPLFALVTQPACVELGLYPGQTIFALIKAPAIHLIPR